MSSLAAQLITNGIIAGAIYALVASGFSLIYNVTKFMNFAHGATLALGAYFMFAFVSGHVPFWAAIILTLIATVIAGEVVNRVVYKPLRKRKASTAVLLIGSLSAMIFVNAIILAIWGADIKTIQLPWQNPVLNIGGVLITGVQVTIIMVAAVLLLGLWLLMKRSRLGIAMRAVMNNKEVAQTVGIDPERMYSITFALSSALAAVAGILIGIEQNLHPTMGTALVIKGFTGAVVGGMVSVPGAIMGSLILGLAENIGIWWLPSGYKDAIAFALLFIFLLVRPQGLFGKKTREA